MLIGVPMTVQQLAKWLAGSHGMASVVVLCISTATSIPAFQYCYIHSKLIVTV